MHKIEERLALLEQRMAMLESQKVVAPERKPVEELFISLGMVYVLSQASDRLTYEPKFSGYDAFIGDVFKCKISDENRMDYAHKLKDKSNDLLSKASDEYLKTKK